MKDGKREGCGRSCCYRPAKTENRLTLAGFKKAIRRAKDRKYAAEMEYIDRTKFGYYY